MNGSNNLKQILLTELIEATVIPILQPVVDDPFEVLQGLRDHLQQTISHMKQDN